MVVVKGTDEPSWAPMDKHKEMAGGDLMVEMTLSSSGE